MWLALVLVIVQREGRTLRAGCNGEPIQSMNVDFSLTY